uniref:Signal recognition particle, SRP19 subunit n=1 Tax=Mycena chlorophos TaxID=658473 RepID=A0ABQ0LUR9_MYCCL|nr:predicted protein [Mycena chlorophos]
MSRRAAVVEEFDDDTDLPLPSRPLPNTGSGPLLQELHISDDESDFPPRAGPASPSYNQQQSAFRPPPPNPSGNRNSVTDITPYKNWTCIYPIYIDAKRAYGTGLRRVPRADAVWWPLSKDIADAAASLGLSTLHEVNKSHPRDWENPGRVRVQWKKDGRLVNPMFKTKKLLLQKIAERIQIEKPQFKPVPPFKTEASAAPETPAPASTTAKGKGKQQDKPAKQYTPRQKLPSPPQPHPSISARISPYSPALVTGMLVDTIKAGQQPAGGMQKGKRKVVRVRG